MKNTLLLINLLAGVFFACTHHLHAQDESSTTVRITITEDGKVTSDTSIAMKDGQDPETIRKVVTAVAGADMDVKHRSTHAMTWVESDGDHVWHVHEKKGGKQTVFVSTDEMKDGEKKVTIRTVRTDNEDMEETFDIILHEDNMEGSDREVEKEVIIIKKGDHDAKVIKQKKVEVIVVEDDEVIDEKGEKHRKIEVIVESDDETGDDTGKTRKKKKKR